MDPNLLETRPDPLLEFDRFVCGENGYDDVIQAQQPEPKPELEPEPVVVDGHVESPGGSGKKSSKKVAEEEHPSWLPEDWRQEFRMRTSGVTAGIYDRYFFSPTGKRFRSRAEVLNFLMTGSKKKTKADADGMQPASSESRKTKKAKRKGDFSRLDFDFRNPPHNVSWTLTSAAHDIWTPSGEEGLTPEPVKKTWDDVYSCITELEGKTIK